MDRDPKAQELPGARGKPVIGLAGGIGSGKSTVASILASLGAAVISSDRLNHEELARPEVLQQLREWFGDSVVRSDGSADRAALRAIIGNDPDARRRLEQLVHPRIEQHRRELMVLHTRDPRVRAIVIDSPLLYEAGLDAACDSVLFVDASDAVRLERVRQRGWSEADLRAFEKTQKPLDFKRDSADHRVENNSDVDALRQQVAGIFSRILSGA